MKPPISRPAPSRSSLADMLKATPIIRWPRFAALAHPRWLGGYPVPRRPGTRVYQLPVGVRRYTSIVARSFWAAAYPCCLNHRYGHGWTSYRQVADDEVIPEHSVYHGHMGASRVYCLGPAPCPTCGKAPPKRDVAWWRDEAAKR